MFRPRLDPFTPSTSTWNLVGSMFGEDRPEAVGGLLNYDEEVRWVKTSKLDLRYRWDVSQGIRFLAFGTILMASILVKPTYTRNTTKNKTKKTDRAALCGSHQTCVLAYTHFSPCARPPR